jgi:hypothetical protein
MTRGPFVLAAAGRAGGRPDRRALPLAIRPLALHLLRLALDLFHGAGQRAAPRDAGRAAVQHVIAAHVQRDFGHVPFLLARERDLRRDDGIAEQAFEPGELAVDQAANPRGDVDVAAGQNESHGSFPCADGAGAG